MEGTITVQMTVEEYNRIQKLESLLSQLVVKVEELEKENKNLKSQIDEEVVVLVRIDIRTDSKPETEKFQVLSRKVGFSKGSLDYDKIATEIKGRVQSIEYIAKEFQKTKQELNRIPKWIRRIFK